MTMRENRATPATTMKSNDSSHRLVTIISAVDPPTDSMSK
jgi:hypothetical protein